MSDVPRIDPVAVRSAQFQGSFRKYDSRAVDQYLADLADDLVKVNNHIDELERQVAAAPRLSARTEIEPTTKPAGDDPGRSPIVERPSLSTLSDAELTQLVGEETAHVLSTARQAAADIRAKAEESAARLIRESTAEAKQLREDAEAAAAQIRADAGEIRDRAKSDADAEAQRILDQANADAERRVTEARAMADDELVRAERVRAEADADAERVRNEAKEEGRAMLAEAKEVRKQILEDLQRRRDQGRAQIERLVVGRDRLLEAYASVRANVDEMTQELATVLDSPFERDPGIDEGFVGIVSTSADVPADGGASPDVDAGGAATGEAAPAPEAAEVDTQADDEAELAAEAGTADGVVVSDGEPVPGAADMAADRAEVPNEVAAPEASSPAILNLEPEAEPPAAEAGGHDDQPVDDDAVADADADASAFAGPSPDSDAAPESGGVDELFARIRAEREESVARAQAVLAADTDDAGPAEGDAAVADADPQESDDDDDGVPAAEVDQIPAEHLATGPVYEHRRDIVDSLAKDLSRSLKRQLADEQNQVLDALRRTESTNVDDLLPMEEDHLKSYVSTAQLTLVEAAAAAAASSSDSGTTPDVSDVAQSLAAALVGPFRRRVINSASEVGDDHEALDERLRSLYREWKIEHLGPAASDALYSAYAVGQYAAAAEGARLRWLIDPEQGPCPDAQDNALEGSVTKGDAFPTGDRCPQAHAGCRCLLLIE